MVQGQLVSPVDNQALTVALTYVVSEYKKARRKHAAMNSAHEGYAVLLEEVDELWDAIKKNDNKEARAEAIQVAAMALAFLVEVTGVEI